MKVDKKAIQCMKVDIFTLTRYFYVSRSKIGAYCFCPVCRSVFLSFSPPFWNFNLANNFWTVSDRAFIFHMIIPCDKNFPWVSLFFTLLPWPWSLTQIFENFNLVNNFWTVNARALIFHMNISCDKTFPWFCHILINIKAFILHIRISCNKIFLLVSRYLSLWSWPSLNWPSGICVSQTDHKHILFSCCFNPFQTDVGYNHVME